MRPLSLEKKEHVSFRIPKNLKDIIKKSAEQENRSISSWLENLIREYLAWREEKETRGDDND